MASAGASVFDSACSRTRRSSELPVEMRAPMASSSSAILNVSRVVVPSSSRSSASDAPGLLRGVGRVARVHRERHVDERARMPFEQHHLEPVAERGALHLGNATSGGSPSGGTTLRSRLDCPGCTCGYGDTSSV
jgi:hypothetical protein